MTNKYLFSFKIEEMNYVTKQEGVLLTPSFDSDAIDDKVIQKLNEMNLKINSFITYVIKDGFLVAEGMAYENSELNIRYI